MSSEHVLLLGTNGDNIYGVIFDSKTKTLRKTADNAGHPKSSWLTQHPTIPNLVYLNNSSKSKIYSGTFDKDGKITVLDEATQSPESQGPCHFTVAADNSALIIANYGSGNVCMIPLDDRGRFLSSKTEPSHNFTPTHSPVDHPRQTEAHAHQVVVNGNEVLVPDLGSNKVWRVRPGLGEDESRWVVEGAVEGFEVGDGPRHVVVHPNGKILYVLNEISSELTSHTLPANANEPSKLLSRYTLLPPKDEPHKTKMKAAAMVLLPQVNGGKALLVATNRDSPRGQGDAIALFAIDQNGGVERAPTPWIEGIGQGLRGMAADKSGKWIAVAGEQSGGLTIYERVGDVELKEVARLEDVEKVIAPTWV